MLIWGAYFGSKLDCGKIKQGSENAGKIQHLPKRSILQYFAFTEDIFLSRQIRRGPILNSLRKKTLTFSQRKLAKLEEQTNVPPQ